MAVWFLTGASSGIGWRLAEGLLDRGHTVAATARRPERLGDLSAVYGDRLWTRALDITDTAAVRTVVDQAVTELGRLDVVVSNAGYGLSGAAEELTDDLIDEQIATNLTGSIQLIRAVLPVMRAQGGGRIVQLSSMGGQMAYPGMSLYHATKWGIEGFVEALIPEVAPFGIGVTLVEPGGVRTDFGGRSMALPAALDAYASGPAGELRRRLEAGNISDARPGDPARVARAIIESVAVDPAPRRITLGSDAFALVGDALRSRLDELDAQRELAFSTDVVG